MATYAMSDIHGDRARFHALLDFLAFSAQDRLYILGDVIDRGPEGIELLQDIRRAENMTLLLGNHEYMCLQYYAADADETVRRRWDRNRNAPTKEGLARCSEGERAALFDYIAALPSHLEVRVGRREFYLVHGFPGGTVHDEVWQRPQPDTPSPFPGKTLLIGHTPVVCLGRSDEEADVICAELAARGEHLRIFHGPGYLDLDCLCGYEEYPARALACLRLDDMAEFYG